MMAAPTLPRERGLTEKEVARELFVAGYLAALDEVTRAFAAPRPPGFLEELRIIEELRALGADMLARAAIAKATGSKP